jgi:methylmalonyl-CoA mutase cobalamin-binding subunit
MKILLAPFDPVHDVGLKLIKRKLDDREHRTILLPPDVFAEEVVDSIKLHQPDAVLIGRTVGYDTATLLGNLMNLIKAKGLRDKTRIGIGGMAVTAEMGAQLGYDACFPPRTPIEDVIAFVEQAKGVTVGLERKLKQKRDLITGSSFAVKDKELEDLLNKITAGILDWTKGKISPGIKRARITESQLESLSGSVEGYTALPFTREYMELSDQTIVDFYRQGKLPAHTRLIESKEVENLYSLIKQANKTIQPQTLQYKTEKPVVFIQYGTGCPMMDAAHIKVCEAWGADGVLHFDPAWGARTEGLPDGYLADAVDGTPITYANLSLIKDSLLPSTLWSVRAHRGLNTPEIIVLAGFLGADLTKINIAYGSLGAGTDPARLTVDGVEALKLAAKYQMPFDIPTNEELCGVPAYKAFAGMLIMAALGLKLGAKPLLKPLICYSPEVIISGKMEQNYVEYNTAKIIALRELVDIPIWAGEPIGFMTHTEEKIQSASTTSYHFSLMAGLGVDVATIASTDEVYSRGPITGIGRIGTLSAVKESFRFFGKTKMCPSDQALKWKDELKSNIKQTLKQVAEAPSFVDALYTGILGSKEDGAYPGRFGKNTVSSA